MTGLYPREGRIKDGVDQRGEMLCVDHHWSYHSAPQLNLNRRSLANNRELAIPSQGKGGGKLKNTSSS